MSIFKSTKKTLVGIFLILAIIFSQIGLMLFYQFKPQSIAYASYEVTSELSDLKDPSFTRYTSNSNGKPFSPTYWTSAGGNSGGVSSGIISVDNDVFNDNDHNKFGLTTNPGTTGDDSNIIMIKTKDNTATSYGYKTSSTLTLSSNDYYLITVLCKTDVTTSNGASIYINSSNIEQTNLYNFVNINTQGDWETFSFYIQTNPYSSTTVDIELWLGSKDGITSSGVVFFDDIHVYKLNNTEYQEIAQNDKYDFTDINNMPLYVRTIDLKTITLADTQFENSNFEQGLVGWEQTNGKGLSSQDSVNGVANIDNSSETLSNMGLDADETIPGNTNTYGNKKALFINNKTENTVTYASTSTITIKQHGYYRLSLLLKTGNITSGGATLELKQVVEESEEDSALSTKIESATSSSGLTQYNGYQEYAFYISGSPFGDEQLKLYLTLDVIGYVIFDDISLQQVDYSTYASSSSTYTLKLTDQADTETILNGAFNFSANTENNITYPLAVQNWTTENSQSGIVNINDSHWNNNSSNYGASAVNPGAVTGYPNSDQTLNSTNNVLMIRNSDSNGYAEYKSNSISLSSNTSSSTSIVGVEVWVKTQSNLSNPQSGAYIRLEDENGVVLAQISNIRTHDLTPTNAWQKYTLYLKNSLSTINVYLVLGLGNNDNPTSGYAYFDNVKYLSSVTDETISAIDTNYSCYTDLAKDSFNSYIKQENGVNTPYTFVVDGEINEATTAGVINLSNVDSYVLNQNVPIRDGADNEMLMIKNNAPTQFSYKSSITRTLGEGYYKVSVWVYTLNLSGVDNQKFGANIKLSNVEDSFENIVTSSEENNGWVQYSFYVNATTSTDTTLYLSLGNADFPTQGYVFFDDIEFTDITVDDYTAVNPEKVANTIKTTAEVANTDEDTDDETTTEQPYNNNVNLWFLIPSIILAIALIIAIVGYAMRKIKFRNPFKRKEKSSNYDRTNTLNGDIVRRELAKQRSDKVKEIDNEISKINKLIESNKNTYEENLKAENSKSKQERLFTKYAKERTKLQKQLDNLNAAKAYILDENNIKIEEEKEIRRRQALLEEENKKSIKNPSTQNEPEKQEEKQESEKVKKARARSKMNK